MILSYRHKGLAELADTGKAAKARPDLWVRAARRLDAIATAKTRWTWIWKTITEECFL